MKTMLSLVILIVATVSVCAAQTAGSALATATGLTFTANDLSPDGRKLFEQRDQLWVRQRNAFFDDWVFSILLDTEAKARGITEDKVRQEAAAKVTAPTEAQIKAVYDANRQSLGNATLDQVRARIVDYLKHEAEDKLVADLVTSLKAKHKYTAGKDVNATDLKAADVVGTIGVRTLTAGEFAEKNKLRLHNFRSTLAEQIRSDLEASIYSKLIEAAAKKRNIDASSLLAVEITNKMKDYTDYERASLEDSLQSRLFEQYAVKFNIDTPEPVVLNVSTDDDPSIGNSTAKVTVVAFVDFQCSACASFSPMLKQVVGEFGGTARLVVRDFPLTSIHDNAMQAALAGYAARQQGKFFEMADLMYRNQSALDADSLRGYARQLGMDLAKFDADMKSPAATAEIKKDIDDGNSYGVSGTPTIFVNGVQIFRLAPASVRGAIKQGLK